MTDEGAGWAVAGRSWTDLLQTTDAGQHWATVRIPPVAGAIADVAPVGASSAFLAYTGGPQPAVLRTHDAGQTWQSSAFPVNDATGACLYFLDKRIGWLLLHTRVGMGHDWLEIFRTEDGGSTWVRLTHDLEQAHAGDLPDLGGKSRAVFTDANTGWIAVGPAAKQSAGLYRTGDGGATWQIQHLAFSGAAEPANSAVMTPQFFSAQEGILPVALLQGGHQTLYLFATHDGGNQWTAVPPLPTDLAGPLRAYFASPQIGWVWEGKPDSSVIAPVYQTQNGGRTWSKVDSPVPRAAVVQLAFVSAESGWALTQAGQDGQTRLFTSDDGGVTWKAVAWQSK